MYCVYSLFKNQDDFVFVLENIFEVDNFVWLGADGEQRDLVEDLHGTVHSIAQSENVVEV